MIKIQKCKTLFFENSKCVVKEADIYIDGEDISGVRIYNADGSTLEEGCVNENVKFDKVISGKDRLAIPGLVNAHTHAYMAPFRNIADDVPFSTWLFDTVSQIEDNVMTDEDAKLGTTLAAIEMIKSGTTCYLDMHMNVHYAAKAAEESGLRAVLGRGIVGGDRNDEGAIRRLTAQRSDMKEFAGCSRLSFMYAPHAPYTCGEDLLKYIGEIALEENIPVTIHIDEAKNEHESYLEKYHKTPTEYVADTGLFRAKTVAAHCVQLSGRDFDILKEFDVSVAANPCSNLKLANGVSNVPLMLEKGINIALGTDGAASNNSLNMFKEMSFEALLHKGLTYDPTVVTAGECVRMATVNGAKAVGLEGRTGEIKVGYKADIAILNLQNATMIPYNDIVASLVYSCNGSETDTVIVNGKVLMEGRRLLAIDEEKVYYEAEKTAQKYRRFLAERKK